MSEETQTEQANEQWAVVEIMGHLRTSGRISRPGDWGGLLRVDVPMDGTFRTEYYGMAAIYSVKLTSKEIAMAYADHQPAALEYDAPIVTRAQYQELQERANERLGEYLRKINALENRLRDLKALPDPAVESGDE